MLSAFGVDIEFRRKAPLPVGGQRLRATDIVVPADFSSAAFYLVAASIIPGSELRLKQVGSNPRRTGLPHALRLMGRTSPKRIRPSRAVSRWPIWWCATPRRARVFPKHWCRT